ncbi:hypothetical protein [Acuticoccus kandeliae]|uniref:hypothetical protein n=1 Tax=Acuticoccus kandeliae TaxID=2073160 RepID=UPI001B3BD86E|nr:hypothetical protein [Acuticoccus kandeliae]
MALSMTPARFPVVNLSGAVAMLAGGLLATIVFDLFGQWLTPTLGYARLAPVPLATQSLEALLGPFDNASLAGTVVHWVTGILFYPIGYAFIALPVARTLIPPIHWFVVAVVYGVVLWVFALYVMAHLVAGNPPFLGFTGITYVALIGHVIYAVVLGAVLARRG